MHPSRWRTGLDQRPQNVEPRRSLPPRPLGQPELSTSQPTAAAVRPQRRDDRGTKPAEGDRSGWCRADRGSDRPHPDWPQYESQEQAGAGPEARQGADIRRVCALPTRTLPAAAASAESLRSPTQDTSGTSRQVHPSQGARAVPPTGVGQASPPPERPWIPRYPVPLSGVTASPIAARESRFGERISTALSQPWIAWARVWSVMPE